MTPQNLTDEERKGLTVLYRTLSAFAEINSNMPVGQCATLVAVALDPMKGPQEYSQATGQPDSTMSRWLLDLSMDTRGVTEAKLLGWRPNPENLRRKQYFLTAKGSALIGRFLTALEKVSA